MNGILQSAVDVSTAIAQLQLPYCLIGGIALQRWGEPRMTVDVDVTILAGFGNEISVFRKLAKCFAPRIPDAESFAEYNRIALLVTKEGVGVDVSLGALPFEERVISRATDWLIPDYGNIRTCSAVDLIVLKAFAARDQDWIDIRGTLIRQRNRIDRDLILEELTPLAELKEEPEILTRLNDLFESTSRI